MKKNDKVVCISNGLLRTFLDLNTVYIIENVYKDPDTHKQNYIKLKNIDTKYSISRFITLQEYRKLKLKNITT